MEQPSMYQLAVVVTVAVCYYNSLGAGFVFDDVSAIVDNKDLRPHSPVQRLFWNDFWGTPMHKEKSHKSYRPLCVLTFRLNYLLHELDTMGYHLVNVVLHAVVCLLFLRMCRMFLPDLASFVAAFLFAIHPIHVEAVTGVVGRAEALSSIFFLLALMSFSKSTGYRSQIVWRPLMLTVVLVTIAMLCKEQGITVIGVCCVYEVFVAQRATFMELLTVVGSFVRGKPSIPPWLRNSIVRAGFLVGTTLFLLFARIKVMGAQLPVFTNFDNPASQAAFPARHLTFNYLLPVNVWLLLCPSGLCCDWTMGTIPLVKSLLDVRNAATLGFYACMVRFITYMLNSQDKRNRAIIMALTLMVLPFIPASNLFFPVGFVVAERILYTPSMGFCMLVALGFQLLLNHHKSLKPVLWALFGLLLLTHGLKTHRRNWEWKSEYTLFQSALKVNQRNAKCFNNVGHALEKEERYTEALEYFAKAASVQPDDIGAHMNVGRTYNTMNRSTEAELAYKRAMDLFPPIIPGKSYTTRVAPNHLNVYLNLASLVSKDPARLAEADSLLRTAISMRPDYVQGYINRGDIMVKMSRLPDALEQYKTALQYEPENADVHYNMGVVNLEMGNAAAAKLNFEEALRHDPEHMQSLYNSAIMLQEGGNPSDWPEAHKRLGKLKQVNPADSKVHFTLGMLEMDRHDFVSAESHFKRCIELEGDFKSALFNLALLLTNNMKKPLEAVPYLENLLQFYPNHTKGNMLMGDINVNNLKNLDAAEKNFNLVIELEPLNVQAHHNLCVVYVEKRDLFRAEKCLTNVHNMAPEEKYIFNHLQIVRSRINDAIKAHKEKQRATQEAATVDQSTPGKQQQQQEAKQQQQQQGQQQQAKQQQEQQQRQQQEQQAKKQQEQQAKQQQEQQQRQQQEQQAKQQQEQQAKQEQEQQRQQQAKQQQEQQAKQQQEQQAKQQQEQQQRQQEQAKQEQQQRQQQAKQQQQQQAKQQQEQQAKQQQEQQAKQQQEQAKQQQEQAKQEQQQRQQQAKQQQEQQAKQQQEQQAKQQQEQAKQQQEQAKQEQQRQQQAKQQQEQAKQQQEQAKQQQEQAKQQQEQQAKQQQEQQAKQQQEQQAKQQQEQAKQQQEQAKQQQEQQAKQQQEQQAKQQQEQQAKQQQEQQAKKQQEQQAKQQQEQQAKQQQEQAKQQQEQEKQQQEQAKQQQEQQAKQQQEQAKQQQEQAKQEQQRQQQAKQQQEQAKQQQEQAKQQQEQAKQQQEQQAKQQQEQQAKQQQEQQAKQQQEQAKQQQEQAKQQQEQQAKQQQEQQAKQQQEQQAKQQQEQQAKKQQEQQAKQQQEQQAKQQQEQAKQQQEQEKQQQEQAKQQQEQQAKQQQEQQAKQQQEQQRQQQAKQQQEQQAKQQQEQQAKQEQQNQQHKQSSPSHQPPPSPKQQDPPKMPLPQEKQPNDASPHSDTPSPPRH